VDGVKYKIGLNNVSIDFQFYGIESLQYLLSNYDYAHNIICTIKIPENYSFIKCSKYFYLDKIYNTQCFIIEEVFNILDFVELNKLEKNLISIFANNLQFVSHQTEELCMLAVRRDGYSITYVKNQTEDLCIEAIRQNSNCFKLIKNLTVKICLEAVKKNGFLLEFIDDQTEEICIEAVNNVWGAIQYVSDVDFKFKLECKRYSGHNAGVKLGSEYEGKKFYKLINKNMMNRNYKFELGLNVLTEAFNPYAECSYGGFYFCDIEDLDKWVEYFPDAYVFEVTLPVNSLMIKHRYKYKADKIIIHNPIDLLDFIEAHSLNNIVNPQICMMAVRKRPLLLEFFEDQTLELCTVAVKGNPKALAYVNMEYFDHCLKIVIES
jgi:hypothetical protein